MFLWVDYLRCLIVVSPGASNIAVGRQLLYFLHTYYQYWDGHYYPSSEGPVCGGFFRFLLHFEITLGP